MISPFFASYAFHRVMRDLLEVAEIAFSVVAC